MLLRMRPSGAADGVGRGGGKAAAIAAIPSIRTPTAPTASAKAATLAGPSNGPSGTVSQETINPRRTRSARVRKEGI